MKYRQIFDGIARISYGFGNILLWVSASDRLDAVISKARNISPFRHGDEYFFFKHMKLNN